MLSDFANNVLLNSAVLLWLLTAIVLLLFARGSRRHLIVAVILLAAFWFSGTSVAARLIMGPLENAYEQPYIADLQKANVHTVVVLTGGGYPPVWELASVALPHASTFRFLASLELCQRLAPNCEIIFSGSAGQSNENVKTASTMEDLAKTLTPDLKIISEANSNSTIEHPKNVGPLVGDAPFALVTSAYHMPRAMLVFKRAGLNAIPYPVDFYTHDSIEWSDLIPDPQNWEAINLALHEYFGILYYSFAA